LQRKVGKEVEDKALRSYSKERIPSGYRKAVAEYYEELSKGASDPPATAIPRKRRRAGCSDLHWIRNF